MPVNTLYLNSDELFPEFAFAIPGTMGSTIAKANLNISRRFISKLASRAWNISRPRAHCPNPIDDIHHDYIHDMHHV
jgi:hypothetical protein